jgi:hypothetical protein
MCGPNTSSDKKNKAIYVISSETYEYYHMFWWWVLPDFRFKINYFESEQ